MTGPEDDDDDGVRDYDVQMFNAAGEVVAETTVEAHDATEAYYAAGEAAHYAAGVVLPAEDTPVTWMAVQSDVPDEPPASVEDFDSASGDVDTSICEDWD